MPSTEMALHRPLRVLSLAGVGRRTCLLTTLSRGLSVLESDSLLAFFVLTAKYRARLAALLLKPGSAASLPALF